MILYRALLLILIFSTIITVVLLLLLLLLIVILEACVVTYASKYLWKKTKGNSLDGDLLLLLTVLIVTLRLRTSAPLRRKPSAVPAMEFRSSAQGPWRMTTINPGICRSLCCLRCPNIHAKSLSSEVRNKHTESKLKEKERPHLVFLIFGYYRLVRYLSG